MCSYSEEAVPNSVPKVVLDEAEPTCIIPYINTTAEYHDNAISVTILRNLTYQTLASLFSAGSFHSVKLSPSPTFITWVFIIVMTDFLDV